MEFIYFSTVSFYLIIYLILTSFYYFLTTLCNRTLKFQIAKVNSLLPKPPRPWALPILGHLHLLAQYEVPYQAFKILSKTHGQIFGLKLGVVPVVVVNGLENIKEVLFLKAADFDGRPNIARYNDLFGGNRENSLAFCNFSNIQKTRREILQAHTFPRNFSSRFMKLNSILEQNLSQLKSKIDGQSCLPNFKVELSSTIANVFFVYFCNKSFDTSESRFQEMIRNYDSVFYEVNQGYASDFLPWLTYFQSNSHKRNLQKMSKSIRAFFMECLIKERIDKLNSSPKADDDEEEDYVDSLLNSVYTTDEEVNIPLDTALFSLEDIIGGHSAISNFILKTLGFLVNNPEVQAKIQKEIDVITSNERSVSLSDRKKMPYTEATILESIRMIASPIVPHVATQDSSIGGFEVQKDTLIFLNNYELSMSPDLWSEPERFQPERFINTEGRIVKPEYFLPFSGGRRSCMGKKMVQLVSFMTVASLFQSYGLHKVTGHEYKVPIGDLALPYETFQFKFEPRRPRDI